jgi:hypothetical protein
LQTVGESNEFQIFRTTAEEKQKKLEEEIQRENV